MKSYTVILVTSFSRPWNDGWYYKAGFEKNGHRAVPFDPSNENNPAQKIAELVDSVKPDFILHTKDELPADTFQQLRKKTAVVQWYPDVTIHDWLPQYVAASDVFFTMCEGLVEDYRKFNPRVFWLTQAFEPSYFEISERTAQDVGMYASDVTFVGSLGMKDFYQDRREGLQRISAEGFSLTWWGPRLPRKLSTLKYLWGGVGKAYGGKFVYGQEHAKIAALSKIYLAFDAAPQVRKSMSERLYIAVGCGAFYMCRHVEGIEEVLVPDREIVTFHTMDEMIDKVAFYLGRDDERRKISEAGRQKVLREHTYETRIHEMIGILEKEIL